MIKRTVLALLTLWAFPTFGQISGAGQLSCNGATITGTAATSATSNNTVLASFSTNPATQVLVQLDQTSTITGGVISFQVSYDNGANYINVPVAQVLNPSTGAQLSNPYTLVASTNQAFLIHLAGASSFQIKLTTAITGTATVTPYYTALCTPATIGPLTLDANGNLRVTSGTTPGTSDATSTSATQSTASTNATNVKASAGNVYGIYIINTTTTNYFLRMYNLATSPTCSSATGFVETIPALGGAANGGGISRVQSPQAYSTGIGFCLTGGGSSTDNTNAATGVYVTILYK